MKLLNQKIISKLTNVILFLIVFLAPLNLFFKLTQTTAYVTGLLIDYLIPKFYLVDGLIICFLSVYLIKLILNKNYFKQNEVKIIQPSKNVFIFLAILTIFIIRQAFTENPIASVYFLLRLVELGSFFYILLKQKKEINKNSIFIAIILTLVFQSSLAIYQFHQQKSLFKYQVLGETKLTQYYGIAKGVFNGEEKILPYGTTAHPNNLGGVLVIYIMVAFTLLKNECKTYLKYKNLKSTLLAFTLIPSLYTLYLTQSVSAVLTFNFFIIAMLFSTFAEKINLQNLRTTIQKYFLHPLTFISLLTAFPLLIAYLAELNPSSFSLTRRSFLNQAAWEMFIDNIWWGTGLNNFILQLGEYIHTRQIKNFIQPVHHVGLLFLAETGLLGILLLVYLIKLNKKQLNLNKIFFLIPIITLDHYLITQPAGLISVFLLFLI